MNRQPRTIAVDLTPVLPGGENGGAKIFVLELLCRLAAMAPKTRFVLLTQAAAHDELAWLDRANVSRRMIIGPTLATAVRPKLMQMAERFLRHVPARLRGTAFGLLYRLNNALKRSASGSLLREVDADLLFCPFTAPVYAEPGTPTVCTIYDLQYKTYPDFFSPEDVDHRDRTFREACRHATYLAAISDYSRNVACHHGNLDSDRIRTIHLRMAQRVSKGTGQDRGALADLGLETKRYLIYPANFWKHKNHEMLLTAFGIACREGLDTDIKLVCTGSPGERQRFLAQAAATMGLKQRVVFPGYLPNDDLAVLMANACGLVFPSLYEGFGLPVIEAMATGIPVACSNTTSLPEVAAGAAILFDPRVPVQIATAMVSLTCDQVSRNRLITDGLSRASEFADADRMAREYWELFLDAMRAGANENGLTGVYGDGWCGPRLAVRLAPDQSKRTLQLELLAPDWLPAGTSQVRAHFDKRKKAAVTFVISRGATETLSLSVPRGTKHLELHLSPDFVPSELALGADNRHLSLMIKRCSLQLEDGSSTTLYPDPESCPSPGIATS